MLKWLGMIISSTTAIIVAAAAGAYAADDWTFLAGKYAVSASDCKSLASGQPLSRTLAKKLENEVLTREGITSPRETHCRFRTSTREKDGTQWTVSSACEELGQVSPDLEKVKITKSADGSLGVIAEDTFGPNALVFRLCPK